MKNILLSLSVICTIAACKQKADTGSVMPLTPAYNNSAFSDTAKVEEAFYEPAKTVSKPKPPRVRTVYVTVPQKQPPVTTALPPVVTPPVTTTTPAPVSTGNNPLPSSTGVGNDGSTGTASTIPEPAKKTGWSKAAKGAVIGAGAGAIGGAILSKKKGLGAVIGGVVGAAGGYAIGKGMDKKDNRFIAN